MKRFLSGELPPLGPVMTFGNFDGVHLGHQEILRKVVQIAQVTNAYSLLVTFDPHPRRVLTCDPDLCMITSLDHKMELFKLLGIDAVWVIQFDQRLASMSAEVFIEKMLFEKLAFKHLVIGAGCFFGKERKGDALLLESLAKKLGYTLDLVEPICIGNDVISSTRIRQKIKHGCFADLKRMLGRDFSIWGVVEKGRGAGTTIGYSTANLRTEHELFPPRGVYAVEVRVSQDALYQGVANVGIRPTFFPESKNEIIEVHLLDFHKELIGHKLEVFFRDKLRDEAKFESAEALKDQIAKDINDAKFILRG